VSRDVSTEHLRELTPQVLGAVVRRYGHFDVAEDAVQEALLAASQSWPQDGIPDNPRGWLITVASRRLTDRLRSDGARRLREERVVADRSLPVNASAADAAAGDDDTLLLLFMCCHPSLSPASQIALTLRAVGGLTTTEIAKAFLVPDATMGQRISRAKEQIRSAGSRFAVPRAAERRQALEAVLHVLYLIFNEGYTATSGSGLHRSDLSGEAIRLTRLVLAALPDDGEIAGLLALMLLTDARRPARTDSLGDLIPLSDQDRSLWDRASIAEGVSLITESMARCPLGPYQLQAAIAALHSEAPAYETTDWAQILALYRLLEQYSDNPMVTLNQAVALAMVVGSDAGLAFLRRLETDPRVAKHHRVAAVKAHLLEDAGDRLAAAEHYRMAARLTTSAPERRYLESRAATIEQG
jgi:RNA polymerase sigma factor (sigma-70 family)